MWLTTLTARAQRHSYLRCHLSTSTWTPSCQHHNPLVKKSGFAAHLRLLVCAPYGRRIHSAVRVRGRWTSRPAGAAEKVRPAHGGIYATKVARSGSLGDLDLTVISTVHERQAMKRCQSRQEHSTPTVPPLIQKLPLLESVGRAQRAITGVGRICSYGDPLPKFF